MNNKTFTIVICVLIIASVAAFISYLPARFDTTDKIKMQDFPKAIGEWKSKDVPLSKQDYEILETTNLIMREYTNAAGQNVLVYIVYSEDNRKVSHPPEVCYTGGGASIIEKSTLRLSDFISANRMVAETANNNRQLVVYWYKAGNLNTDKYLKQQLKISLARTFGKKTSGALIRLSTDIKESNEIAALNLIKSFTSQIEPLLPKYVP